MSGRSGTVNARFDSVPLPNKVSHAQIDPLPAMTRLKGGSVPTACPGASRSRQLSRRQIPLSFAYFSADGPQIATEPVSVNVNLTSDQFDAAVKSGYPINVDQTIPAATNKVRIVVQDTATCISGSLIVPIASQ